MSEWKQVRVAGGQNIPVLQPARRRLEPARQGFSAADGAALGLALVLAAILRGIQAIDTYTHSLLDTSIIIIYPRLRCTPARHFISIWLTRHSAQEHFG